MTNVDDLTIRVTECRARLIDAWRILNDARNAVIGLQTALGLPFMPVRLMPILELRQTTGDAAALLTELKRNVDRLERRVAEIESCSSVAPQQTGI